MVRREFFLLGATVAIGCRRARLEGAGADVQAPQKERGLQPPQLPTRTFSVRLVVVPKNTPAATVVSQLASGQFLSEQDVFVVWDAERERWYPKSRLRRNPNVLVDHDRAVSEREPVVVLRILQREQVQFESNVPFEVTSVTKKSDAGTRFQNIGNGPDDPFDRRLQSQKGGPEQPIRSGPPREVGEAEYSQLYKVTFTMTIDGINREIDPDVYCEWG